MFNDRTFNIFKDSFYISIFTILIAITIQFMLKFISNEVTKEHNSFEHVFFLFVFVSPFIESLLSILVLMLCSSLIGEKSSCLALGFAWAGLHSSMGSTISNSVGLWLVSFISFFIYGRLYFKYRQSSLLIGIFVITFPHSLHNLYVYIILYWVWNY